MLMLTAAVVSLAPHALQAPDVDSTGLIPIVQTRPTDARTALCDQLRTSDYAVQLYGSANHMPPCHKLKMVWLSLLSNSSLESLDYCMFEADPPQRPFYLIQGWRVTPTNTAWLRTYHDQMVQAYHWVEVTHCADPSEAEISYGYVNNRGAWFYVTPGSGISLNVGRTIDLREENETHATMNFTELGYDSLQYSWHHEMNARSTKHELIMIGEPWVSLTYLDSGQLALRGLLKCGAYPHLRDCSPNDAAVRLMSGPCEAEAMKNVPLNTSLMTIGAPPMDPNILGPALRAYLPDRRVYDKVEPRIISTKGCV